MSHWEIIGTVLGIVGVALMIRQHVWTWPVGLVQVSVYAWVFYDARLYSDALLQVCFFAIQAYGWWHWWRGTGADGAPLRVTRTPRRTLLGWALGGSLVTALWGETMRRNTDAALPHWDAFILVFSLVAQWLQARKQLENWAGWMLVNVVAIGVYWAKDLRLTAGLYVVFFILAAIGHRQWRRALQPEANHA